jgi:outer membrane protein assembly factor BamB
MSSDAAGGAAVVDLGTVTPAGSRHTGRRSALAFAGDTVVVGTTDGTVAGFDAATGDRRWQWTGRSGAVVAAAPLVDADAGPAVVVGERGPDGEIRCHDAGAARFAGATAYTSPET